MGRMLSSLIWSFVDPVLVKIMSRMEHLKDAYPSTRQLEQWKKIASVDPTVHLLADAELQNYGNYDDLVIGAYTHVRGQIAIIAPGGQLKVGHHCYVGSGSRIWAQRSIEIGDYVLISHLVDIHDTNAHPLDADLRKNDPVNLLEKNVQHDWSKVETAPVKIKDNVWIGFKSSVLKGVTIGEGAVIAAGSVVIRDVPPHTLVAGNPAIIVRELK